MNLHPTVIVCSQCGSERVVSLDAERPKPVTMEEYADTAQRESHGYSMPAVLRSRKRFLLCQDCGHRVEYQTTY